MNQVSAVVKSFSVSTDHALIAYCCIVMTHDNSQIVLAI